MAIQISLAESGMLSGARRIVADPWTSCEARIVRGCPNEDFVITWCEVPAVIRKI
jgi:hypothetical protein